MNSRRTLRQGFVNRETTQVQLGQTHNPNAVPALEFAMASNGAQNAFTAQNVLTAMLTMRSHEAEKKKAAMDYLTKFQKSVRISLIEHPRRTIYVWS